MHHVSSVQIHHRTHKLLYYLSCLLLFQSKLFLPLLQVVLHVSLAILHHHYDMLLTIENRLQGNNILAVAHLFLNRDFPQQLLLL